MVRASFVLLSLAFYLSCSRSFDGSVDNLSSLSSVEDSVPHTTSSEADLYAQDREMEEEKVIIKPNSVEQDTKFSARCTAIELENASCGGVRKIFASLSSAHFAGIFRGMEDRVSRASSFYVKSSLGAVPLVLHAGDIRPDFAAGAVAGGARGYERYERFSLFKEPLYVAPGASFYGTSLRGVAAAFHCSAFRAAAFAGRKRILRSGKVALVEPSIAGTRLEIRKRNMRTGFSFLATLDERERHFISGDTRYVSDFLDLVLEIISAPERELGAAAAFAWKIRDFRAAFIAYSLPSQAVSPLSSINGAELRSGASNSGSCFSLSSKLFDRCAAKLSIEQRIFERDFERRETNASSAEIEKSFKQIRLRFSVRRRSSDQNVLIPYPSFRSAVREKEYSRQVLVSIDRGSSGKLATSLEDISQGEGRAFILRSTVTRRLFSDRVKCVASYSRFDAICGNPRGIYYEPSLSGAYPFVSVSHDDERFSLLISLFCNKLSLSCKAIYEVAGKPSISAEGKLDI